MELSKNKSRTKKLVISGILIAISTILGTFSIPLLGAKVAQKNSNHTSWKS